MVLDETHFVMKNGEVKQPKIATDGLQLYYDMKGKKDTDIYNDRLLDMSGNNKHGTLSNFAYDRGSGFSDGLVFDGVDDTLTRPDLDGIEIVSGSRNLSPVNTFSSPIQIITGGTNFSVTKVIAHNIKVDPTKEYKVQATYSNPAYFHKVGMMRTRVPVDETITDHNLMFTHTRDILDSSGSYITLTTGGAFARTTENESLFAEGEVITFSNIQLEEGSAATPYVPYIPVPKMTYQLNGNILSYDEGGVVRRVQDGQVVERKGINLLRNGNFWNGNTGWWASRGNLTTSEGVLRTIISKDLSYGYAQPERPENEKSKETTHYITASVRVFGKVSQMGLERIGTGNYIENPEEGLWYRVSAYGKLVSNKADFILIANLKSGGTSDVVMEVKSVQDIDLTATFGAGNEPTLEQIQAEPEKWAWTPNPMDLLEAKELNGNILGDVEGIIDDLSKDEVSGESPIFTTKADDSVVRVEVDGKSEQANPPYREVTGESIIVENNEEGKLRKLVLDGKSFQNAGSGKNLFDIRMVDKTLTSNGDTIGASIQLKPHTSYTLSTNALTGGTTHDVFFSINLEPASSALNGVDNTGFRTITTDESGRVAVWVRRGGASAQKYIIDDFLYGDRWIQLEEGSTPTPYEPPAPTPDYPITINSLNNVDVVSSVSKENLLPNSQNYRTSPNNTGLGTAVLMTDEDTPYYRVTGVSGISTYEANSFTWMNNNLIEGNEYTASMDVRIPVAGRVAMNGTHGQREVTEINIWVRLFKTFTWIKNLRIFGNSYTAGNQLDYRNWKIEEGAVGTPWIPTVAEIQPDTQTPTVYKTNISLVEPLRSVGNVQDRLFRDSDGLWKVERNVGEYIITGNEAYSVQTRTNTVMFATTTSIGAINKGRDSIDLLSSNFVPKTIYSVDEEGIYLNPSGLFRVSINQSRLTANTVSAFKTWLTANPVTIIYQLATSTIETLPPEYQQKLNQLYNLYSPATYFYTVSDIKGTLTAGYKLLPTAEPMTGDIFAPTPDYPEEIKSFDKSFDVVSSVGNRNYFLSPEKITLSHNYANGENLIIWNRTSSNGIFVNLKNGWKQGIRELVFRGDFFLEKNEEYTLSLIMKTDSTVEGNIGIQNWLANTYWPGSEISMLGENQYLLTQTFLSAMSVGGTHKNVRFFDIEGILNSFYNSGSFVEFTDFKLEKGAKASPYTPAPEDTPYNTLTNQTYKTSISLAEPLRSVGNMKDRLFRDSDGKWKVERNIGYQTFDENSVVTTNSYSGGGNPYANLVLKSKALFPMAGRSRATHLKEVLNPYSDTKTNIYFPLETTLRFRLDSNMTLSDYKSWLKSQKENGTPFTIEYQLDTPTLETLPEETQQQLNNLPSFDGTTYVYTVNESGMNPHMKAEFLPEDFKKENLTVNSLKIYNRPLEDAELLKNYTIEKERFSMGTPRIVNPTAETLTLTQGNFVGNTLSLDYTLEI